MATIKVTIYDDFGQEIGLKEKIMKSSLHDFNAIEEEVEQFRQAIMVATKEKSKISHDFRRIFRFGQNHV